MLFVLMIDSALPAEEYGLTARGMAVNPAIYRGHQLKRENIFPLPMFAPPENLASRDRFGRSVPRKPPHFCIPQGSSRNGCCLLSFHHEPIFLCASPLTITIHDV